MNIARQLSIATASIAIFFTAIGAKPADAAFVGNYDPSKWTLTNDNADGSVDTSGSPNQIQLFGGNNANRDLLDGVTDYTIKAVADGVVSFKWTYSTADTSAYFDGFSFLQNDSVTNIFDGFEQTGNSTFSTTVAAGDVFGFSILTLDNVGGRANVIISDFSAPVPEPFTVGGSIAAFGIGLWMKRKQSALRKS